MNCFPCFSSKKTEEEEQVPEQVPVARVAANTSTSPTRSPPPAAVNKPRNLSTEEVRDEPQTTTESNGSRTFTFRELATATKNFKQESLIGEGGFGKLYKGKLTNGEVVAVKQLDRNGTQGSKGFLDEVLILTRLDHPNLVKLIGYCADGDQRLLVYECLSFGSLDVHLHGGDDKKPLDWQTRMKIASGVAQGLEYLHEKANPPILYHTLKPANVLLNEDLDPRLSGYGLAKLANGDTKMHATPRVMGTYGYCAPEYERQGELTMKSDVYSFGVILLEIITGRKALDTTKPTDEQNLVSWAQPIFKDQKKFINLADPHLEGRFPQKSLNQAVGIAAMCLQEEPSIRPLMGDVLSILNFLAIATPEQASTPGAQLASENNGQGNEGGDRSPSSSSSSSSSDDDDDSSSDDNSENEHKDKLDNSKKRNSLRSKSGGSSHSSSRSYDDNVFQDENGHKDSADPHRNGSINSSIGNGRYEDSFAWSISSSSNYQHHDGSSARQNSGHINNLEFHKDGGMGMSMRQQSIPNT